MWLTIVFYSKFIVFTQLHKDSLTISVKLTTISLECMSGIIQIYTWVSPGRCLYASIECLTERPVVLVAWVSPGWCLYPSIQCLTERPVVLVAWVSPGWCLYPSIQCLTERPVVLVAWDKRRVGLLPICGSARLFYSIVFLASIWSGDYREAGFISFGLLMVSLIVRMAAAHRNFANGSSNKVCCHCLATPLQSCRVA